MPTYIATATATSSTTPYTVAKPTGTLSSHLMLLFQAADTGGATTLTTPTGGTTWSLLASTDMDVGGTRVWWKIAGDSEPSTYGLAQNSGADGVVAVAAIADVGPQTPFVAQSTGSGSNTVSTPSGTPFAGADIELRWAAGKGASASVTWTPPATYTEQADLQSRTYTTACLATKQLTSSSATGALNFTASSTGTLGNSAAFTVIVPASTTARIVAVTYAAVQRAATW
ncbi:hypothetical protein AB0395_39765 [Streptosporangium sp. NPDC051023]|uniref:hypothetical protein n=1 Tax=Streptosporangium sp. NPDC051023 TaxID=3155410 RepID=UPI00344F9B16